MSNYMVLDLRNNSKSFINRKSGVTLTRSQIERKVTEASHPCALYVENARPRYYRGDTPVSFGKRWEYTGVTNTDTSIEQFVG